MTNGDLQAELTALDDPKLCILVQKGSESAFEEITKRYKGLIKLIAKEYSYPGFDSSDFMQLGLMGLFGACKTYNTDNGISFKNFAALCIRRRFISLVRSQWADKAIPADSLVSIEDAELYSEKYDPQALIADKESDREFLGLIKSKLSFMELSVLKGYADGLSYAEIAAKLGLDTKAVDNALQRARKKLSQ